MGERNELKNSFLHVVCINKVNIATQKQNIEKKKVNIAKLPRQEVLHGWRHHA